MEPLARVRRDGFERHWSGQPFGVIDYSGAVGSIFYSINDGITNPIVPLNTAAGCSAQKATTGAIGNNFNSPALNAACFTVPVLAPGALNGAIPPEDVYETNFTSGQGNIFRQSWQKRADASLVKDTKLTERYNLKYGFDVYNLTNHPSYDIPIDNVSQNLGFSPFPSTVNTPNAVPSPQTCASNGGSPFVSGYFYQWPTGLGQVTKTIGSSRQIQMTLRLTF